VPRADRGPARVLVRRPPPPNRTTILLFAAPRAWSPGRFFLETNFQEMTMSHPFPTPGGYRRIRFTEVPRRIHDQPGVSNGRISPPAAPGAGRPELDPRPSLTASSSLYSVCAGLVLGVARVGFAALLTSGFAAGSILFTAGGELTEKMVCACAYFFFWCLGLIIAHNPSASTSTGERTD
jgi:hypothetical protein